MTTWRKLISEAFEETGDTWDSVVSCTLTEAELDVFFDRDYGSIEGKPFTLWTIDRVYFPWCYDGLEGVAWVFRWPDGKPTEHIGGD